jgi:uncharacterized DUF497 family protein
MQDDEFEWDDIKAASNVQDHGVTFKMARAGLRTRFRSSGSIEGITTPEERFALLGMVDDRLLFVSYTLRGARIRIISARKAEPNEPRRYHDENRQV